MPEHHAGRLFLGVKQVQLLANLAMIALLRLFYARQVLLELLLVRPGRAVNALQHFIAGITAPVGAGHFGQLEGLELASAGHMRATAQSPSRLPADRV